MASARLKPATYAGNKMSGRTTVPPDGAPTTATVPVIPARTQPPAYTGDPAAPTAYALAPSRNDVERTGPSRATIEPGRNRGVRRRSVDISGDEPKYPDRGCSFSGAAAPETTICS